MCRSHYLVGKQLKCPRTFGKQQQKKTQHETNQTTGVVEWWWFGCFSLVRDFSKSENDTRFHITPVMNGVETSKTCLGMQQNGKIRNKTNFMEYI